jgi:hypothetical protein
VTGTPLAVVWVVERRPQPVEGVSTMARVRIGELLMRQGRIDELQLQSALAHQSRWGGRLGRAVVHLGFLDEATLL